jgi:hypothetical protein
VLFPGSGNGTSAIPMCQTTLMAGVSQVYGRSGSRISGARDEEHKLRRAWLFRPRGGGRPGRHDPELIWTFWSHGQTGMTNECICPARSTRLAMSLMFIVHDRGAQLPGCAGWFEWPRGLAQGPKGSPEPWRCPGAPPLIAKDRIVRHNLPRSGEESALKRFPLGSPQSYVQSIMNCRDRAPAVVARKGF